MTVENDCLTPTLKVRRNFAMRMFAAEINELYDTNLLRKDLQQVI